MPTDEEVVELMRSGPFEMDSKVRKKTADEEPEQVVEEEELPDNGDHDEESDGDQEHHDEELGILAPLRRRRRQAEDDGDGEETPASDEAADEDTDAEDRERGDDPAASDGADPPAPGPALVISGTELVPTDLDAAVEQIRVGWDMLDQHLVHGYLALSEKLRAARDLYNQKNGKGRGKKSKDGNQAPTPDFATYMEGKLGREASRINKLVRLSAIDLASRRMIEERPKLGEDFSVLHALVVQKEPEKRVEAIEAFDKGGRKALMGVLRPPKARPPTPEPSALHPTPPSPPSSDPTPAGAGLETETPAPASASAAPETPTAPDADSIEVTDPILPQVSDLPRTIRDLAAAYGRLLNLLPQVHAQRVRVAATKLIHVLDRNLGQELLNSAMAQAVEVLRMEEAGAEELSKILENLPDDGAVQSVGKSLCKYRDDGGPLSPKWLGEAQARIEKSKAAASAQRGSLASRAPTSATNFAAWSGPRTSSATSSTPARKSCLACSIILGFRCPRSRRRASRSRTKAASLPRASILLEITWAASALAFFSAVRAS